MPYLPTSEAWLQQSSLLLAARPSTTRITTKYTIHPLPAATDPPPTAPPASTPSRASLILKTYDPASGTTLKYRTDKAAEVGRLVGALGRLGRGMAGLSDRGDEEKALAPVVDPEPVKEEPSAGGKPSGAAGGSGGGGGGGKRKKKGGRR
ncbi:MAG: hypothetical protein M1832_004273 [Thelocarpon impressellum]|nr:MAG: hypothetical protein M1832_004273 [Thelocarpon impressellum]